MRALEYQEPTAEEKDRIAKNIAIHKDAQRLAEDKNCFVLCGGLIYHPSGLCIAYAFNYAPGQREGLEELVLRAGGLVVPGSTTYEP